jgi:hypothetical protein
VLPEELLVVVVLVEVAVFVEPVFFPVSSPQPTIMPNPNSKANAKIFFIFSTSNKSILCFRRNLSAVLS